MRRVTDHRQRNGEECWRAWHENGVPSCRDLQQPWKQTTLSHSAQCFLGGQHRLRYDMMRLFFALCYKTSILITFS